MAKKLKFFPYSHSKMAVFTKCKKQFWYKFVIKHPVPFEPSFHLDKGDLVHGLTEAALKGKLKNYKVKDYKALTDEQVKECFDITKAFWKTDTFSKIRNADGSRLVEGWFNLNDNLEPVTRRSTINGKIDFMLRGPKVGLIVDWKTGGKSKEALEQWPQDYDQLQLYALWALQKYKNLQAVKVEFVFVEHDHVQDLVVKRSEVETLREKFLGMIDSIETETEWDKTRSKLCAWCDFRCECMPDDFEEGHERGTYPEGW